MSHRPHSLAARQVATRAELFHALGDATRLALLIRLAGGGPRTLTQLTEGAGLTRQGVTKHLRVLEHAGLVRCSRSGRESYFEFHRETIETMKDYLDSISGQWDQTLSRLQLLVED